MPKKILIIGGEGNGSVIAGAIVDANNRADTTWEFAGYLNDRVETGGMIHEHPVKGKLSDVPRFLDEGYYFINTILRIDGNKERIELIESLGIPDDRFAIFVHPMSYVAPNVSLEPGTVIMPNACVSANSTIGKNSLVMVGATVLHDTVVGRYCHLAAQSCLGAHLNIGEGVHIGLNSTVREHISIGAFATLGMGAVLTKNIGPYEIWAGNPARKLRRAD